MKTRKLLSMLVVAAMVMTSAIASAKGAEKDNANVANETSNVKSETGLAANTSYLVKTTQDGGELAIYFVSDIVTVSCVNKGLETAIFTVSDENGEVVYRRSTRNNPMVHYRVMTQSLPEGKYYASLKVGDEKYTNAFEIER